ncbi:MAG TPA: imelysin family protein [Acidimicrobiales bacterium]|nr:imelysin family protein [Acidimicrobiales bacterium]
MRTSKLLPAALLVGALVLSACSSSSDGGGSGTSTTAAEPVPVDVGEVLQGLAEDVIVPSYEALGTSLATLATDTQALCDAPSEAALTAAQEAWTEAVAAYQRTRPAGVGPALDDRLMSDLGFAARQTVIDDLLESGDPVDHDAVADEGSAARGLYAVEIALFGEGSDTLTSAEGARRCEYVASVAAVAQEAAQPVIEQWTDGDAVDQFVAGLDGGPESSVALLVNEVTQRLTELEGMGLLDMTTAETVDDLDPSRVGGPADQRLADRKALMAGISAAIGDGSTGISALVGAQDAGTRDRLVAADEKASKAVAALPDSVAEALEDPKAVQAASDAVTELKVLVSTEVASKLGVTITFSDSDGDS